MAVRVHQRPGALRQAGESPHGVSGEAQGVRDAKRREEAGHEGRERRQREQEHAQSFAEEGLYHFLYWMPCCIIEHCQVNETFQNHKKLNVFSSFFSLMDCMF